VNISKFNRLRLHLIFGQFNRLRLRLLKKL